MKHRTHKDFPTYRFYQDGRILNKKTRNFIKVKPRMKLVDLKGYRRSITTQKYLALLFPKTYSWRDHRGRKPNPEPSYKPLRKDNPKKGPFPKKYDKSFVEKIQKEATHKTYDSLVKEYNIPMGSIGYLLRMGKGKLPSNGVPIVININRVIIRK